jgi:hypothetical protein
VAPGADLGECPRLGAQGRHQVAVSPRVGGVVGQNLAPQFVEPEPECAVGVPPYGHRWPAVIAA